MIVIGGGVPPGCRRPRQSLENGGGRDCAESRPLGQDVEMADGAESEEKAAAAKIRPDSTLDATGLLCPLPVLKARRALRGVPPGGFLEVLATDPGATKDFEHFCQTTGCTLVAAGEDEPGGILRFLLRKPG